MYIIFGSKKNVYKSIPLDGVETIEKYLYKFYGEIKLELSIGKVTNTKSKIKVIDCSQKNCENFIPVKFFGNYNNIELARKEIEALICYGNLKTNIEKLI